MKILSFFIFFISFSSFCLEKTHLKRDGNTAYFQLIRSEYIPWLEKELKFNFEKIGRKESQFIKKNLNKIDHWNVSKYPMMEQFIYGFNAKRKETDLYLRIYIHKSLRNDPLLKSSHNKEEFLFFEWDEINGICFISETVPPHFLKKVYNQKVNGAFFKHTCRNGTNLVTRHLERKDSFVQYEEFITYNENGTVIKTMIKDGPMHPFVSADELNPFINKYIIMTMLPLNKYSIEPQNRIMIYVP